MAKIVENNPHRITVLYIMRNELELGHKKGSVICRMLFRDNSMEKGVNYQNGRLRYLPHEFGWEKFSFNLHQDGSVTKSQIGIIFPRFSINQENDKIASYRKYIQENCPYMPTVLSPDELRAALWKNNLDLSYANQNVAVINV